MRNSFFYGVGGVLSADIAVPEHDRELSFYSQVLTSGNAPLWRDDLMNNLGMPIIGLGVRVPEYDALPLQWMPHFQVSDVAASVKSAIEMGGKELMHSKTDDGQSQWAVLEDQVGAAFGVIPVVAEPPEAVQNNQRKGRISWLSLMVPDASSSRDFYKKVVGWNAKSLEAASDDQPPAKFEMQVDDETAAAEFCQISNEEVGVPPVWLIHLPVDDFADSLRKVSECGGQVIKEYTEQQYAIVRDPIGVYLALQAG